MILQPEEAKRSAEFPESKVYNSSVATEYWLAALASAGATGIGFAIRPWSDYWAVAVVYLFTIVLLGLRLRQGAILFAATVCALTWDFLFFPPIFSFMLVRLEDCQKIEDDPNQPRFLITESGSGYRFDSE